MKTLLLSILLGMSGMLPAQSLAPGDIVILGYAADTGTTATSFDEFTWASLVDIPAGTVIYFTDAGYNSIDANFMASGLSDEILIRFIVPAGGVAAGTITTITEESMPSGYTAIGGTKFGTDFNGLLSIPNAGDQILVFQSDDDPASPATFGDTTFYPIFMITGSSLSFTALNSATADITPVSDRDNVTNLPPGLTVGVNAVAVGVGNGQVEESDNARYVGITQGSREEILAAVTQLSNWARHDEAFGNDLPFGTAANGWTANGVSRLMIGHLSTGNVDDLSLQWQVDRQKKSIEISGTDITETHMSLYNLSGSLIKEVRNSNTLQADSVASGVYLIRITIGNRQLSRKVML